MRIEGSLYTGLTGLLAHGGALSVIGDNIANFNTTGFKKQRAEFADLVADASSRFSMESAGSGSQILRVRSIFSDGSVESTSRELDFAIQGSGFFIVSDGVNNFLTRAGNFSIDKEGFLISSSGLRVLGFTGQDFAQLGPINLKAPEIPPRASANASLTVNLDASTTISTGFPPNPTRFSDLAQVASFSASVTVVNSLGGENQINLFFAKTGVNTWEVRGYVNGSLVGQADGVPVLVGQGILQFSPEGQMVGNPVIQFNINWVGANPQTVQVNFADSTQYATPSFLKVYSHDGEGLRGDVMSILASEDGRLSLLFKNGATYEVGYFGIGVPASYDDLMRISENLYSVNGPFNIFNPFQQNLSCSISSGGLERSNVDISEEFVSLILNQKGFAANSKVISSASEILDIGINLKR